MPKKRLVNREKKKLDVASDPHGVEISGYDRFVWDGLELRRPEGPGSEERLASLTPFQGGPEHHPLFRLRRTLPPSHGLDFTFGKELFNSSLSLWAL